MGAIAILIEKAKGHVATGKAILAELLETIIAKLSELKDNIAGYKAEYISITDIMDAAQVLKDIFARVKAKIESGEIKDNIVDATPAVKAILEKVDEAIQILIEKAKGHVETGRAILVDLFTDVLKPALKHAIEGLIPVVSKHLGDLADKLVGKTEYLSITDIFQAVQALKDVFDQIKAKIESGEIHDNLNDFLEKIKDVVEAKMTTANEHVKAILEKVDEAVKIIIERVNAHLENGRNVLVDLLETIIAKIGELKDNLAGYNILDDLLNDVLKPALKHAIDGLIPVISKHLGNLADKLVG